MPRSEPEVIDITVVWHAETDKAILVSDDGEKDGAQWLPKSQIEYEMITPSTAYVTLPVWLAREKRLI